jgi:hypothetical protein
MGKPVSIIINRTPEIKHINFHVIKNKLLLWRSIWIKIITYEIYAWYNQKLKYFI